MKNIDQQIAMLEEAQRELKWCWGFWFGSPKPDTRSKYLADSCQAGIDALQDQINLLRAYE